MTEPSSPGATDAQAGPPQRAGVVGSPIAHSLSPVLHRAAYAELGLHEWAYEAAEVRSGELAAFVGSLDPQWVGLSVTMPLKGEALALADVASDLARRSGGANTLVRTPQGWSADNTDVHGLFTALQEAGAVPGQVARAIVVGGGATACSALLAVEQLAVPEVDILVRQDVRSDMARLLETVQLRVRIQRLGDYEITLDGATGVIIGTLPGTAPAPTFRPVPVSGGDASISGGPGNSPIVFDVAYAPWPSPLALAVEAASAGALSAHRGTGMLLHQAVRQVELMTGRPGPTAAMRAALVARDEGR